MFLKSLIQLPFKFFFFGLPCSTSAFGTFVSTEIGSSEPSEVTFYFLFSDVECRCVGKFFGVCNYFKALYNPIWQRYKYKCIRCVAKVWRFKRINSRKKRRNLNPIGGVNGAITMCKQTTKQVASLSSYYSHKCCSRKFVRKKLDLTNVIGLLQTIKTHTC